jgi:hypothetical protein
MDELLARQRDELFVYARPRRLGRERSHCGCGELQADHRRRLDRVALIHHQLPEARLD